MGLAAPRMVGELLLLLLLLGMLRAATAQPGAYTSTSHAWMTSACAPRATQRSFAQLPTWVRTATHSMPGGCHANGLLEFAWL